MAKMVETERLVYFKCPVCGHVAPGVRGSDMDCPACEKRCGGIEEAFKDSSSEINGAMIEVQRMRMRSDGSWEER